MASREKGFISLKRELDKGNIAGLYVFHGEETYLLRFYLERIKTALVGAGLEAFNYRRFDGKNLEPQKLAEALEAVPMMSERTLTVVTDLDIFGADEAKRTRLTELFGDIPDYACLILVYETLAYKPDKRYKKLYSALMDKALVIEFEKQGNAEIIRWIRRRFTALGKDISPSDAEFLVFRCGSLMTGLISEVEKIAAYSKQAKISREDIRAVAEPTPDAVVFELAGALSEGKYAEALAKLETLLAMGEEPIMLLALLGRQCRQIYAAKLIQEKGRGLEHLMELYKLRSAYPARLLLKAAEGFSRTWCENACLYCAQTDLELKSGSGDKKRTMELLLLRLAQEAGMS